MPCKIHGTTAAIDGRLEELGLTREILAQAVKAGLLARREHTENHPVTSAGFNTWSEAVRSLRDQLAGEGWEADNTANQGLTTHEARKLSIAVVPGDKKTGIEDSTPSTRSARGPRTADAVRANGTGFLFKEMEERIAALMSMRIDGLWLLLIYVNEEKQWVQSELSRPTEMSDGGRPTAWSERILLPAINFSSTPDSSKRTKRTNDTPPVEKSPEIVVEVKRRA
ncbi:MAG TPA: hypothetical protein VK789_32145 [Bryobacteraceae bacterium]|nr:hypothetical protein [Bryobacteraceae bacterium]